MASKCIAAAPRRGSPAGEVLLALLALVASAAAARAESITLEDCERLALARAPQRRVAAAEARAATQRVRAAEAAYLPRFFGQADYGVAGGYDEAISNGGLTAAVIALELPLFDGGRRGAQLEAARSRLLSATQMEQQRRADVVLSVRGAYAAGVAARDEVDVQADAVRVLEEYVELLRAQESRGLIPPNDVLRARIALETGRSDERSAAAIGAMAMRELSEITGVEIGLRQMTAPPNRVFETPADDAIETSPALADARAQAEVARHEADAVRGERWGNLVLTADAGFVGVHPDTTFRENGGGQFLLGFRVPIYDGGGASAREAEAEATAVAAEASVELTRQAMRIAVARAQADATRALVDEEAWRGAIPTAADSFQLMRARYFGGGNVRLLEVLDALNQSVAARVAAVRARLAYESALANRDQILGVAP